MFFGDYISTVSMQLLQMWLGLVMTEHAQWPLLQGITLSMWTCLCTVGCLAEWIIHFGDRSFMAFGQPKWCCVLGEKL